ncbi:hypothetical protein [Streptomyces cuspidosporus]|uniref:Uncharacterized protein n=1 Tax=Streptomyces cuspidosporus TaxID=66882 RepID=A0ABN3FML3_9ACTN
MTGKRTTEGDLPEPPLFLPTPPGADPSEGKSLILSPHLQPKDPPATRPKSKIDEYLSGMPSKPVEGTPELPPSLQGKKLKIATSVLRAAADSADKIYDDFSKPAAALEEPTKSAVTAMGGWESARALKTSHGNWEAQAGTVVAWLQTISESLRAAARSHTSTDHEVWESIQPVWRKKN